VEDPTRYFCESVLKLRFPSDDLLPEDEPLDAGSTVILPSDDPDDGYLAGKIDFKFRSLSYRLEAAQRRGDTRTAEEIQQWMRFQPEMPLGQLGATTAEALTGVWWTHMSRMRETPWLPPVDVRCTVGAFEIVGRLDCLTPDGRLVDGFFERSTSSAIKDWVRHLVLCVLGAQIPHTATRTIFRGPKSWMVGEVPDAATHLVRLCELYVSAQREPLPFFRRTARKLLEKTTPKQRRATAGAVWDGYISFLSGPVTGEREQPWNQLCWYASNLLEDDHLYDQVERWAEYVLGPMNATIAERRAAAGANGDEEETP
jgi:exonuclease V gamma subunit